MRVHVPRKPRLIAGRFSRAERRRQRAHIHLDEAALTHKTQVRYYSALKKMVRFVELAKSEDHLDALLCRWIRKMWHSGEPLLTMEAICCWAKNRNSITSPTAHVGSG